MVVDIQKEMSLLVCIVRGETLVESNNMNIKAIN